MNPTFDIKGEHAAIKIILDTMKKLAYDMRIGKFIDSYRIVQILDFLHAFSENCHSEKEEKCLYPALLEQNIPWTSDTINYLISEHRVAYTYIQEIDHLFEEYLSGNNQVLGSLSLSMLSYIEIEETHIKTLDNVILPLCEKLLDKNKLKSISVDFKRIQDHNVGHLKHLEYYKLLSMLNAENDVLSASFYY